MLRADFFVFLMRPLRVLHVIDHLGIGGAQQIIDDIVRLSPDGAFAYIVLYFFDRHRYRAELEARGARVICLGFGAYTYANILVHLFDPRSYLTIAKVLREERFAVIHIHLFYAFVATLMVLCLRRVFTPAGWSARVIYTMHAMRNQVPRFFLFLRMLGNIPDVIVGDLPAMVAEMQTARVPARRFAMIHTSTNFVSLPATDQQALREEVGLAPDQQMLVAVGRLHRQKGYRYFLEAMPRILQHCPRTVAVIVGDGEELVFLRRLADRLGLGSAVRFVGFRADTVRFYDAADLFVHPASEEALPIVVLDAMARGKSVIACRVGALASVVRDGETGYLVERKNSAALADAVITCLINEQLRIRMGQEAKRRVAERYVLDDFVARYYALYKNIVL